MKAIGYKQSLPITHPESLIDVTLTQPIATGRDLLIKVSAIAVNPADYKVRLNMPPVDGEVKVIGWDAVGEVIATGDKVSQFKPGDHVYYAGDITRSGSNAEFQLVDERLVGFKPKSLSNAEAAALPLTAITAWELLFEHLGIKQQSPGTATQSNEVILVVGAAGGVGSIFVQLAKTITGATVIGTASRESSSEWVKKLGADYVVDHTKPLTAQIEALNIGPVTHVASLNSTDSYFESYTEVLAPFGKIAMIDDPQALDVTKLKLKSLSLHWEFMFARSMFNAVDMQAQSDLLNRVADLVDQGYLKTTLGQHMGEINAANLRAAHSELEAGRAIGKIVLEGF
ncbi:zinc-binding alcohol dehydrogenase family protein [Shewanella basaltis]|jgi:zinc-binding alcohol dehydrogenase family protein|uniref:zinc-binding alcohol dehydrogenase family protein n=1 Tax=Shewanella basaltis TaxID=472183 RepID=UPI00200D2D66|nr:zinc-binding alcohol dehydrogenase family protein [Shewanella basaltis]MCL1113643.1 zinc-binding alcohol dehydrogenase family protein [Shewanella basaltis]